MFGKNKIQSNSTVAEFQRPTGSNHWTKRRNFLLYGLISGMFGKIKSGAIDHAIAIAALLLYGNLPAAHL
jgi:hypothetical protein